MTPIASGLGLQYGWAPETTVGVAVAPTRYEEINDESLKFAEEKIFSQALAAGRKSKNRYTNGLRQVQGDIDTEVMPNGFGAKPQYLIGGSPTTTTPGGATLTRLHTTNAGTLDGKARTIQIGRPNNTGTVDAYTYPGAKVTDWELTMEAGKDGLLMLKESIDALDQIAPASISAWVTGTVYPLNSVVSNSGTIYVANQAMTASATFSTDAAKWTAFGSAMLGTVAYPSSNVLIPWSSANITIAIGGTNYDLSKVSLGGTNNLSDARTKIGSNIRKEQAEGDDFRAYPISMDMESYAGLSAGAQTLLAAGTESAIVATFAGPLIETTFRYQIQVTLARCVFTGDNPQVGGVGLVGQSITGEALYNSGGNDIVFTVQNTDTTA